jgi:hypothetical protein
MKGKEQIQGKFEKDTGRVAKKIKWETICVETKEHPEKPKVLITGVVDCIYPTGDIAFQEVTSIQHWTPVTGALEDVVIPSQYKDAKKVVIRREIIAAVLYLKELPPEPEPVQKDTSLGLDVVGVDE